ncbi:LysR family transcriptional regulator [Craterilacuibacter sp.]|uniref:LysR family transcriptional regulator n=1 Tax=Craterilacuibacter sp. TaxID=2870909 RepID=UPI003F3E4746
MRSIPSWDGVDIHLLKVLNVLLNECSVSRAALKLGLSQPAVSTSLKRLREISGDPLLVRGRFGMTPTERGLALHDTVRAALEKLELMTLIGKPSFEVAQTRQAFSIASPDYLHAGHLGRLVSRVNRQAPGATITMHALGSDYDWLGALESGEIDCVIGNWPEPPEHLRTAPLFETDFVVLMRSGHPLLSGGLNVDAYLGAGHLAPTPHSAGPRGNLDLYFARERLRRHVVAQVPYFNLAPYLLLQSDLLFTCSRQFAEHYAGLLPVEYLPLPMSLPSVRYYLLWHERSHYSEADRWFRDQVMSAMRDDEPLSPRPRHAQPA